jgi:hypothetical protein
VARTIYRIIAGREPVLADFLSDPERGRPPVPGHEDLHDGRSVWNTEIQARKKALALPMLGEYVAAVELPDDGPYRLQRTTSSAGHWTLWADSAWLLAQVARVVRA